MSIDFWTRMITASAQMDPEDFRATWCMYAWPAHFGRVEKISAEQRVEAKRLRRSNFAPEKETTCARL